MADACGNSYIVLSSPRRLGIHLDRLFKSAKLGRLKLPFGPSEESPCNTVIYSYSDYSVLATERAGRESKSDD